MRSIRGARGGAGVNAATTGEPYFEAKQAGRRCLPSGCAEEDAMDLIRREQVPVKRLPGRVIQSVLGKDAHVPSTKMTVGFARYSAESGSMEPHQHAEETLFVVGVRDGWVRSGNDPAGLGPEVPLEAGMILHFPELEWHQFGFRDDGFVDVLFCYGQVDHIRPEDIPSGSGS
jgi:hypothetical protein